MATVPAAPLPPPSDPAALEAVIERIESSGNPYALRLEPAVLAERTAPITSRVVAEIHGCDIITGHMITATSWGLFQIMGFNLYSGAHPWKKTVFDFLNAPWMQRLFFRQWLADRGMNYTLAALLADPAKLQAFAAFYNGNAAVYAPAMVTAARVLGYAVPA